MFLIDCCAFSCDTANQQPIFPQPIRWNIELSRCLLLIFVTKYLDSLSIFLEPLTLWDMKMRNTFLFFHLIESLVLQSMRSHRAGHDWATDLNWTKWELLVRCIYQFKVLGISNTKDTRSVVLWWQMPAGGCFLNQQSALVPAGPSCAHPVTGSVPSCAVCHRLFCVQR